MGKSVYNTMVKDQMVATRRVSTWLHYTVLCNYYCIFFFSKLNSGTTVFSESSTVVPGDIIDLF
jgi:hypothetical protein